uniref:Uncharacterized protein n=1 Tax=Lepeophtheirus salmonis TaxID=72036 RepID=A0A0K2TAC1_LEPSM
MLEYFKFGNFQDLYSS